MATNKTPYEVRLDVLKMAQEMIDREKQIEQTGLQAKLDLFMAQPKQPTPTELDAFIRANTPKMYDSSDVVTRANSLYSFVSDSTKTTQIK